MKISVHFRQDWIFWAAALALLLVLTGYFIYAVSFVAEQINAFLNRDYGDAGLIIRYDFDNFNKAIQGKIISQ